jgi:hypothetical protein
MKPVVIAGILLIVLGIISLSYSRITYTKEGEKAEIGPFTATAERQKSIPLPPITGGLALVAGAGMIAVGYRK